MKKNHNTNKKIKTVTIATLTTLTLGFAGVTTAIYLQPSHYKGDTFTNAKTSVSSTTSSTSSSSSSQSESTYDSDTNNYYVYTESNSAEVTNNYSQEVNNSSNQVNNNQSQQTTNNNQSQQTTNNNQQVSNDPYNLLNTRIDSIHKVVEYYNGYYIVTEECQTGYGTKYMYIVYNPETGELSPNGSDMIQEQRNWIDNYGSTQQSQSTETDEE